MVRADQQLFIAVAFGELVSTMLADVVKRLDPALQVLRVGQQLEVAGTLLDPYDARHLAHDTQQELG